MARAHAARAAAGLLTEHAAGDEAEPGLPGIRRLALVLREAARALKANRFGVPYF